MSDTINALVRRSLDAFATNDRHVLNEVLAPDFVIHVPGAPDPVDRETHIGGIGASGAAFSEIEITIEDQIAEGGQRGDARHLAGHPRRGGQMLTSPTGRQVSVAGMDVARCREGKIVERWFLHDQRGSMQRLGALPAPGGP